MRDETLEELRIFAESLGMTSKEFIEKEYYENKLSVVRIIKKYKKKGLNLSTSTLHRIMKYYGFVLRTTGEVSRMTKRKPITDKARNNLSKAIRNSWKNNKTARENHSKAQKKMWSQMTYEEKRDRTEKGLLTMQKRAMSISSSSIELKVEEILEKLNLKYEKQKRIKGKHRIFYLDFYLPDCSLVIECNGTYWHGPNNPDKQERDRVLDDLVKKSGRRILWLWENEINENIENCELKILNIVKDLKGVI